MKNPVNIKLVLLFAVLLIATSCTQNEANSESERVETFESIEKGMSLEDARASLRGTFTELKAGSNPDVDIIILEDGNQLVFIDNVLTDKNTAAEIEKAIEIRRSVEQE